jgi:hypothetical protein
VARSQVARETHTVEELVAIVADAERELEDAAPDGKHSRTYIEAVHTLRHYERRLERTRDHEQRRERDDKRDPRDIAREVVDRAMER